MVPVGTTYWEVTPEIMWMSNHYAVHLYQYKIINFISTVMKK